MGRTALVGSLVLAMAACASEAPGALGDADVSTACARLEDLATTLLQARDATSREEFAGTVERPLRAFVTAAETSGDDRLAELARTYDKQITAWRVLPAADANKAGDRADAALDRAADRCWLLGSHNDFPEEPG